MKRVILLSLLAIVLVSVLSKVCSATLPAPYDTPPYTVDAIGNSAGRNSGGFFQKPSMGYTSLIIWIGTDIVPGSLIMDFSDPFTDGVGDDFAILTSSECWGPLADTALFEFFMDGSLVDSFSANLAPDRLFEFELPGDDIIANRIVVTNTTPDPPGINDLATMEFIDAGIAHNYTPVPNNPPIADAGPDQTIEANTTGGANVQLDGSGSYDPDGDPLTYQWTWDSESATGVSPMVFLPLGITTITLVVNDGMLDSEPDTVDITVQDTTPPEIVLFEPDPSKLWPPNHKFIDVIIMGIALDICDIDLDINVSVEVIDAEGGDGGAEHKPDYEIVDAVVDEDGIVEILFSLRAERAGIGDGRIYRITAEVTDDSGNSGSDTIEVFVPHDRGNRKK